MDRSVCSVRNNNRLVDADILSLVSNTWYAGHGFGSSDDTRQSLALGREQLASPLGAGSRSVSVLVLLARQVNSSSLGRRARGDILNRLTVGSEELHEPTASLA